MVRASCPGRTPALCFPLGRDVSRDVGVWERCIARVSAVGLTAPLQALGWVQGSG